MNIQKVLEPHALIRNHASESLLYDVTAYSHNDLLVALNRPHFLCIHNSTVHIFNIYQYISSTFEESYG